ncbi:MAG: hypothetical protein ACRELF_24400, partial [Gemmataceae bacterium]
AFPRAVATWIYASHRGDGRAIQEFVMSASTSPPTKQSLSAEQRQFLELLQCIRYGRVPRLHVPGLSRRQQVKQLGTRQPTGREAEVVVGDAVFGLTRNACLAAGILAYRRRRPTSTHRFAAEGASSCRATIRPSTNCKRSPAR